MGFWSNLFGNKQSISVERDRNGDWSYILGGKGKGLRFSSLGDKLNFCYSNPALMMALKLNADLFSLVKINSYKDGVLQEENFLHNKLKKPNPFQTWEQWLWDYKIWKDLGTAYLHNTYPTFERTYLYWLNPANIEFTEKQVKDFSKIVNSEKELKEILNQSIKYKDVCGNSYSYKLEDIKPFFNLSNGLSGNWFVGNSIIDSLLPHLEISDEIIKSQVINAQFSGKFLITGKENGDLSKLNTFGEEEKRDIESKILGSKPVNATKAELSIQRFSNNVAQLKLDEQYHSQYFFICKALGIPKDVAETYLQSSTFENQEKSLGKYVNQALKPDADDLISFLEDKFGLTDELTAEWNHLSFMQVFENERAITKSTNVDTLLKVREFYNEVEFKQMIDDEISK